MNSSGRLYPILLLSIPLLAGVIVSSAIGLFTPDFYSLETLNWQIQSRGQDIIDLFVVVPVLAVSALLASKGSKRALLIWAGANLYLVYTFLIFCFAVHFNVLFLLYCMNLGLAFYSILYFITRMKNVDLWVVNPGNGLRRFTSIYFILISVLFLVLWVSEIASWMSEFPVPKTLADIGLLTNPVHVIDLSVFLPGLLVIGILLWKNINAGKILAPVILIFFVLMDITIGVLNYMMHASIPGTNGMLTWVMLTLASLSGVLLIFYMNGFYGSGKEKRAAFA